MRLSKFFRDSIGIVSSIRAPREGRTQKITKKNKTLWQYTFHKKEGLFSAASTIVFPFTHCISPISAWEDIHTFPGQYFIGVRVETFRISFVALFSISRSLYWRLCDFSAYQQSVIFSGQRAITKHHWKGNFRISLNPHIACWTSGEKGFDEFGSLSFFSIFLKILFQFSLYPFSTGLVRVLSMNYGGIFNIS